MPVDAEIVWSGYDPLTEWPLVDWVVVLGDESFQPVWTIQPRTSALLWSMRMGARFNDPHDDYRSFLRAKPVLVDEDRLKRLEGVWAQVSKRLGLLDQRNECIPETPLLRPELKPEPLSADAVVVEIQQAEASLAVLGRSEEITLCATTNKVKHQSKLWALHHRNRLAFRPDELHPEQLEAYKCRWCGSWHVWRTAA